MKWILRILASLAFLGLLLFGAIYLFGTADIRTDEVKNNPDPDKGLAVLKQAYAAHGAVWWDSMSTYEVTIHDQFEGFLGKMAAPYPDGVGLVKAQYIPKSYNGRLIFESGPMKGNVWGLQSFKCYSAETVDGPLTWEYDLNVEFWPPTYQYFMEAPSRIFTANVFSYAGEKMLNDNSYDLVFASWNTAEPQRDIDQYLFYVNKETKMIDRLEYTIRDFGNFMAGGIDFSDFRKVHGELLIPFTMSVEGLHTISIREFTVNAVDRDILLPDPNLPFVGDDKPE